MESGREGRSEKGKKSRSDGGPKEQKLFLNGRSEADLSLGIGTRPGSREAMAPARKVTSRKGGPGLSQGDGG